VYTGLFCRVLFMCTWVSFVGFFLDVQWVTGVHAKRHVFFMYSLFITLVSPFVSFKCSLSSILYYDSDKSLYLFQLFSFMYSLSGSLLNAFSFMFSLLWLAEVITSLSRILFQVFSFKYSFSGILYSWLS